MNDRVAMPAGRSGGRPPIPDPVYVRRLFNWLAPEYERAVAAFSLGQDLRWKWRLLQGLAPRPGERALDLATGTGLLSDRLARLIGTENVVGLDRNRCMLERARAGLAGRRLVRADAVRLPFRDGSFDLVTAGYLLKYVPLGPFLREVRRLLRRGGRFGGYDFSAPIDRTVSGWAYRHYLTRILPLVGRTLVRRDAGWSSLFAFLANIATTSGWEVRVKAEATAAGFDQAETVASLGGAVTWCWASVSDGQGGKRSGSR